MFLIIGKKLTNIYRRSEIYIELTISRQKKSPQ